MKFAKKNIAMTISKTKAQRPKTEAPATQPGLADWAKTAKRVINTSQLHKKTGIDRATIVARLEAAGIKPHRKFKKETQWNETEALAVIERKTAGAVPLTHARTQKTTAETARLLLKLKHEQGELVPIGEVREEAFNLVKAMRQRFKRYARESSQRLMKIRKREQFERTMETDVGLIFDDLKRDYPQIL